MLVKYTCVNIHYGHVYGQQICGHTVSILLCIYVLSVTIKWNVYDILGNGVPSILWQQ